MMKQLIYIILTTITSSGLLFGQKLNNQSKIIGSDDKLGIEIIEIEMNNGVNYYLLFNNRRDSIYFLSETGTISEKVLHNESCIISSRQLDNKGQLEIILEYRSEYPSLGWNIGTYIFNLDTKEIIFYATNGVSRNVDFGTHYENVIVYTFTIEFDKSGNLFVKYSQESNIKPNQKEGLYTLVNENMNGRMIVIMITFVVKLVVNVAEHQVLTQYREI